ncbi:hypothetical protein Tco_1076782, partial [Tanacetum coccineum]
MFYRWDATESNQIRDAWESHIGKRYIDIMRCVRKTVMKATKVNDNVDIRRISLLMQKMEEDRVAAKAQREANLLEWKKTLDDRFASFAQNYSPRNERPTESDCGPS